MILPPLILTFSTYFGFFVNAVGFVALVSRLLLKALPVPTKNGFYKSFLNLLGHLGLTMGTLYADI